MHADEHGDRRDSDADDLDPEIKARLEAPLTEDEIRLGNWVARQRAIGPHLSKDRLAALRDIDNEDRVVPETRREPGE